MTYRPEFHDFPENAYCDERYEELVALEIEIVLNAKSRQTWTDMRREIVRHLGLYPLKSGKPVARGRVTEWRQHFCTLWEMRRWLERERSAA